MSRRRALIVLLASVAAVAGAAIAFAGDPSGDEATAAARQNARATTPARGPFLLVSLPSLGTVTWRCAKEDGRYGLAFRVFPGGATTNARLLVGRNVVASATVQPGQAERFPYAGLAQRLVVEQRTGAGTVTASVRARFSRRPVVSHCYSYSPPRLTVHVSPRR